MKKYKFQYQSQKNAQSGVPLRESLALCILCGILYGVSLQ
jgi:hypothetical protein